MREAQSIQRTFWIVLTQTYFILILVFAMMIIIIESVIYFGKTATLYNTNLTLKVHHCYVMRKKMIVGCS